MVQFIFSIDSINVDKMMVYFNFMFFSLSLYIYIYTLQLHNNAVVGVHRKKNCYIYTRPLYQVHVGRIIELQLIYCIYFILILM